MYRDCLNMSYVCYVIVNFNVFEIYDIFLYNLTILIRILNHISNFDYIKFNLKRTLRDR